MQHRAPILNAPASIVGLLALLVLVHVVRGLLSEEQDNWLILTMAFIPARYGPFGAQLPGAPWAEVTSFFTHMLLHGDVAHLLVNSAWLLAVGTVIARRLGAARFFILSALCGVIGALTFLAFNSGLMVPVIGASGAISGLMAAAFRLVFAVRDAAGRELLRERPWALPRLSLAATFTDRRSLTVIVIWVVINFAVALGLGGFTASGGIAWEAHLGGFFAGLVTFGWFDPGPVQRQLIPFEDEGDPVA